MMLLRPGMSRFTARGGVGYAMTNAMVRPRTPALRFWLIAILLMAMGMLVPGVASAHAGHNAHAERADDWILAVAEVSPAGLTLGAFEDLQAPIAASGDIASLPGEAASVPCGGAACCNTGHGCCVAIPVAALAKPATPPPSRPGAILADLLPGVAAAALPEPPRPSR